MLMTTEQATGKKCPMAGGFCISDTCAAWRWHTVFRKPQYATLSHKSPRIQEKIGAPPPAEETTDLRGDAFLHAWDSYKKAFCALTPTADDFQIPEGWVAAGPPERSGFATEWYLRLSRSGPPPDLGYCGMAGRPEAVVEC